MDLEQNGQTIFNELGKLEKSLQKKSDKTNEQIKRMVSSWSNYMNEIVEIKKQIITDSQDILLKEFEEVIQKNFE